MIEFQLAVTAEAGLAWCQEKGLLIRSEQPVAGKPGSRHWHLCRPKRAGTLELTEVAGRLSVKVHPLRDGGWAGDVARELSRLSN